MRGGRTRRPERSSRTATVAVLAVVLASCSGQSVLRPRFPQVEQAAEAVHGGGERYRDHQTCMKASKSVDDLVRCMDEAHWHFVAHGAVFPERECWEARDREELDRLAPHCFLRAPEHP
jgi:hypothetical protein